MAQVKVEESAEAEAGKFLLGFAAGATVMMVIDAFLYLVVFAT